jgi:nucleotide-binding universal stress UspA family protein
MIALRRVLVPTDFGGPSSTALLYGRALCDAFGAALHVLHVVEDPFVVGAAVHGYLAAVPDLRERALTEGQRRLDEAVPEEERRAAGLETVVRMGRPCEEILRYAGDKDVDLVVMGTHGRTGVAHLLLGSVAERVVRTAPCPVLTVRHPEHEFVQP